MITTLVYVSEKYKIFGELSYSGVTTIFSFELYTIDRNKNNFGGLRQIEEIYIHPNHIISTLTDYDKSDSELIILENPQIPNSSKQTIKDLILNIFEKYARLREYVETK